DDPWLLPRRHSGLLAGLVVQLGTELFVHFLLGRLRARLGLVGPSILAQQDEPRLFARRHSWLLRHDQLLDNRRLGTLDALDAGRGFLAATRLTCPIDSIEIEAGGAVGLDVAKLEAVDRGEVQQPHL